MRSERARLLCVLLGAGVLGAVACTPTLPQPPYVVQPVTAFVVVPYPPPPARVEGVPDAPSPAAVWIDGEWEFRRARWAWHPGRWVVAPPGASYSPWMIGRATDGTLSFAVGVWRMANGSPVPAPRALLSANAGSGSVADPDGDAENTGPNIKRDRAR